MDVTHCEMHKKMAIARIAEKIKEEKSIANRRSVTIEGDAFDEQFVNCNWIGLQTMMRFDLQCSPLRFRLHDMLRAVTSKTN